LTAVYFYVIFILSNKEDMMNEEKKWSDLYKGISLNPVDLQPDCDVEDFLERMVLGEYFSFSIFYLADGEGVELVYCPKQLLMRIVQAKVVTEFTSKPQLEILFSTFGENQPEGVAHAVNTLILEYDDGGAFFCENLPESMFDDRGLSAERFADKIRKWSEGDG